jgi:D-alanyl-lipoteichoic acid acyltransferase DltB (MBOAT superfamily)
VLFNSISYWVFFALVLAGFYAARRPRDRTLLLLVASYVFYGWWDWRFTLLILASTVIDFLAGRAMGSAGPAKRKALLLVSLTANLGMLGFFKYHDFFARSIAAALGLPVDSFVLGVLLPVGISFYTFQSMSYTIDVYGGRLRPVRNFADFALFVSFFPQLVAGPIVRARDFFPQLDDWRRPSEVVVQRGVVLILVGLIKKMVFADQFALTSDAYFADPTAHPGALAAWSGTLAFGMQIFFDFSGYTDIARGCAKLLGFHFPMNFRRPYLSGSITEFWRRWHISLSTWLRDYLYIPLGGNRRGRVLTYRNLLLTMALGGLWHGASWNFVLWGVYHGLLLAVERLLGGAFAGTRGAALWAAPALAPLRTGLTFALVLVGWVPFRAATLGDTAWVVQQMFTVPGGDQMMVSGQRIMVGLALALALIEERKQASTRLVHASMRVRVAFVVVALGILEIFSMTEQEIPFVYFQF